MFEREASRVVAERWHNLVVPPGARYGILGGTFDPPHVGHLVLAQEVYARLSLDVVWFVPAASPPHKQGHAVSSPIDRAEMVARAVAGDERFGVCPVELERAGPSYTVDTLAELRQRWGASVELVLILGWDMLTNLPQWHDGAGVIRQANRIAATHRPGFEASPDDVQRLEDALPGLREKLVMTAVPQFDISSTMIRQRVASGLPIRYLVPEGVDTYITHHGLYPYSSGPEAACDAPARKDEAP